MAGKVAGVSSFTGLPSWVQLEAVDTFDSVETVAQIRRAGLSPAHEVLVAVLKKTFLQKGGGRKEEALFRGFGGGPVRAVVGDVVALLLKADLLTRHKGKEGWIYAPVRSHTDRVKKLLEQLRSSDDRIWGEVESINK